MKKGIIGGILVLLIIVCSFLIFNKKHVTDIIILNDEYELRFHKNDLLSIRNFNNNDKYKNDLNDFLKMIANDTDTINYLTLKGDTDIISELMNIIISDNIPAVLVYEPVSSVVSLYESEFGIEESAAYYLYKLQDKVVIDDVKDFSKLSDLKISNYIYGFNKNSDKTIKDLKYKYKQEFTRLDNLDAFTLLSIVDKLIEEKTPQHEVTFAKILELLPEKLKDVSVINIDKAIEKLNSYNYDWNYLDDSYLINTLEEVNLLKQNKQYEEIDKSDSEALYNLLITVDNDLLIDKIELSILESLQAKNDFNFHKDYPFRNQELFNLINQD